MVSARSFSLCEVEKRSLLTPIKSLIDSSSDTVQVGPAAATKNSKSKPIPEKKTLATPISATTGGREPQPEQEGMD